MKRHLIHILIITIFITCTHNAEAILNSQELPCEYNLTEYSFNQICRSTSQPIKFGNLVIPKGSEARLYKPRHISYFIPRENFTYKNIEFLKNTSIRLNNKQDGFMIFSGVITKKQADKGFNGIKVMFSKEKKVYFTQMGRASKIHLGEDTIIDGENIPKNSAVTLKKDKSLTFVRVASLATIKGITLHKEDSIYISKHYKYVSIDIDNTENNGMLTYNDINFKDYMYFNIEDMSLRSGVLAQDAIIKGVPLKNDFYFQIYKDHLMVGNNNTRDKTLIYQNTKFKGRIYINFDGQVTSGKLAEDTTIYGQTLKKGQTIMLDNNGKYTVTTNF
ncbi:MAG: hypothetical protein GY793_03040 [Proteobacteria bacterium]|nr:hypothetical protein [Pseudomonadota bacterium]